MKLFKTVLIVLLIIAALILNVYCLTSGKAETIDAWVICNPESYVNVRSNPQKKSMVIGRFESGTYIQLDGKKKNGFYHCINVSLEEDEGWISKGYIVFDEPKRPCNTYHTVTGNGRVAARSTMGGKRNCWLKKGMQVRVYVISDEWAVTNKGFIKSEFLEENE